MNEKIQKEKLLQLHKLLVSLNAYGSVSLKDLNMYEALMIGSYDFINRDDLDKND